MPTDQPTDRAERTWVMVDVETNGDCPPNDGMLSLGAVVVEPGLSRRFYGEFRVEGPWTPQQFTTVPIHKITPEKAAVFPARVDETARYLSWLDSLASRRLSFAADTGGFDWLWSHTYLKIYAGRDPFGYSGRDVRAAWMGWASAAKDKRRFGDLRPKGSHTHNALDDAVGNAVAMLKMLEMGVRL